jgi:hypothetical protein
LHHIAPFCGYLFKIAPWISWIGWLTGYWLTMVNLPRAESCGWSMEVSLGFPLLPSSRSLRRRHPRGGHVITLWAGSQSLCQESAQVWGGYRQYSSSPN